jgi:hypothetical protein
MGDFADMAAADGIEGWRGAHGRALPFWPSEEQAGKPLHPIHTERPKACRQCGYHFLFWHQVDGVWRLHHYAMLPGKTAPEFVLHRCGFTSDGKPKAPRDSGSGPQGENSRSEVEGEAPQSGDAEGGNRPASSPSSSQEPIK